MPLPIVTSIISAISIIIGSLLGAFFSYLISKNMHDRTHKEETSLREEERKYEEYKKRQERSINANLVRLDIATAIFQSIRGIKNTDMEKIYLYSLPINKDYANAVASLIETYGLKELSKIYQVYGIIEKVNRDINSYRGGDKEEYERIRLGFYTILNKVYGENSKRILKLDENKKSYEEIIDNDYTKKEYKDILLKLNNECSIKKD